MLCRDTRVLLFIPLVPKITKGAKEIEAACDCIRLHLILVTTLEQPFISRGSGCTAKREMAMADVT